MKTYYKVVFSENGKFFSWGKGRWTPDEWVLEYGIGEFTEPQKGKIFIFDKKTNAVTWQGTKQSKNRKVFSCFAEGVRKPPKGCHYWGGATGFLDFWRYFSVGWLHKQLNKRGHEMPKGTLFSDKVMLLKEVYPNTP